MGHPQRADGGTVSNKKGSLGKQSQTAGKRWSFSLGVGRDAGVMSLFCMFMHQVRKNAMIQKTVFVRNYSRFLIIPLSTI